MRTHVHRAMIAAVAVVAAFAKVPALADGPEAAGSSTVIYNALGGAENGGDSFASGGFILVDEVLTGSATAALQSVTLNLSLSKSDLGSFNVVIAGVGSNGKPIGSMPIATVSDSKLSTAFSLVTVKPSAPMPLAANTRYYVGIQKASGGKSHVVLGNTVDPKVLARPTVRAGGLYYNNGGIQANSGGPYEIRIIVTP